HVQATMRTFEKIKDLRSEEQAKEMQEHRRSPTRSCLPDPWPPLPPVTPSPPAPPSPPRAWLPVNMLCSTVRVEPAADTRMLSSSEKPAPRRSAGVASRRGPPLLPRATLSVNMLCDTVALLPPQIAMPPPSMAWLPVNVLCVTLRAEPASLK